MENKPPIRRGADAYSAYHPPKPDPALENPQVESDATGGLIPYKNPPALVAYYTGIFSLLPCIGIGFAIPAVVCGIIGLRNKSANPAVKGSVHAWIGITLGTIFGLLWLGAIVSMFVGLSVAN